MSVMVSEAQADRRTLSTSPGGLLGTASLCQTPGTPAARAGLPWWPQPAAQAGHTEGSRDVCYCKGLGFIFQRLSELKRV